MMAERDKFKAERDSFKAERDLFEAQTETLKHTLDRKNRSSPNIVGESPGWRKNCVVLSILHSNRKMKRSKLIPSVFQLILVMQKPKGIWQKKSGLNQKKSESKSPKNN